MAQTNPQTDLLWINSTSPGVPKDPSTRKKIRRHAIKRMASVWKKERAQTSRNALQYPILFVDSASESSPEQDQSEQEAKGSRIKLEDTRYQNPETSQEVIPADSVPRNVLLDSYQSMCSKSGFDPCDLSVLTSLQMNRTTARVLCENTGEVRVFLGHKQPSYLSHIPSRYGQISCLTKAIDCVVAQTQFLLSQETSWESRATLSYCKALKSLQKALSSPSSRLTPEILCATEVLGLYEVIMNRFTSRNNYSILTINP
jgi:hypothetical protein